MEVQTKKVKVVLLKPHKVILEIIPTGKQIQLSRKVFEKRLEMGFLEVVNPSVIPTYL